MSSLARGAQAGGAAASAAPPPAHYLHELPAQDEERLGKLFATLDLDGNGRIDVHDLSKALHEAGVHERYAQVGYCIHHCLNVRGFCKVFHDIVVFFFKPVKVTRLPALEMDRKETNYKLDRIRFSRGEIIIQ